MSETTKDTSKLKWYIINTQTSCEQMAKASIEERVRSLHMEEKFGQILIPSENVVELVKGKKATRARKFFPGYIFVQMQMEDSTWHLVKNASKVTGFVGGKVKPPEVPEEEVMRVTRQMETGAETLRTRLACWRRWTTFSAFIATSCSDRF